MLALRKKKKDRATHASVSHNVFMWFMLVELLFFWLHFPSHENDIRSAEIPHRPVQTSSPAVTHLSLS